MVNFGTVSPLKQLQKANSEDRKSIKRKSQPVDPIEELNWNIWPADDVIKVTELVTDYPELLERRHGLKQETVLHRFGGSAPYYDNRTIKYFLTKITLR